MALEVGATGVVAPATRPEDVARVKSLIGDLEIISPGVGAQGGDSKETIRAGADFIIVGRGIYWQIILLLLQKNICLKWT